MFPFKDRVPHNMRSHIVYKLTCEACTASYIGKTVQNLSDRINRELSGSEYAAVEDHTNAFGSNHSFSLNKTEIICSANHNFSLELKESLMIGYEKPVLNRNIKSVPLKLF